MLLIIIITLITFFTTILIPLNPLQVQYIPPLTFLTLTILTLITYTIKQIIHHKQQHKTKQKHKPKPKTKGQHKMKLLTLILLTLILIPNQSKTWSSYTHATICQLASIISIDCTFPDSVRSTVRPDTFSTHYFHPKDDNINHIRTREQIHKLLRKQIQRIEREDLSTTTDGDLWGAIVLAFRELKKYPSHNNKQWNHIGHIVGDLSQPLHAISYKGWNEKWHTLHDNKFCALGSIMPVINNYVPKQINETQLIERIVSITKSSLKAGLEARELGEDYSACERILHSVFLLSDIKKSVCNMPNVESDNKVCHTIKPKWLNKYDVKRNWK